MGCVLRWRGPAGHRPFRCESEHALDPKTVSQASGDLSPSITSDRVAASTA